MDLSFWLERWEQGEIAFHLDRPNPILTKMWSTLDVPANASVLVPLCGKSHDLMWLADKGYRVTGIELSAKAVEEFFAERDLVAEKYDCDGGVVWQTDRLRIFQADFFAVTPEMLGPVDVVYDRAALIALPEAMRSAYVEKLNSLATTSRTGLLITLEYDQSVMNGPPFSVPEHEVNSLFSSEFSVTQISNQQLIDKMPRFQEKGLKSLYEPVYQLIRR